MARLPFDPTRARGAPAPDEPRDWTPTRLAQRVKTVLGQGFTGTVRLRGEVSNLRERNHWYFDLKDDAAVIHCVCWASAARKIAFDVNDGTEVIAVGRVDFFEPQGKLQLYVDRMEAVGRGALEAQLKARHAELDALGYFDPTRKRPLPLVPRRVAVVTSRSASALQDVIDTARQRWPGVALSLVDVRVQGKGAADEIAAAVRAISDTAESRGIDAGIVTRGGGSIEDLWAFNERVVCDAVHTCAVPIVAAIGHETDTTLAELCADARAATPTQAATRVVPDRAALTQQLDQTAARLTQALQRRHDHARQRLEHAASHALFQRPDRWVGQRHAALDAHAARLGRALPQRLAAERRRLDDRARELHSVTPRPTDHHAALNRLAARLHAAAQRRIQTERKALDAAARTLHAVSPARVLDRGFTLTLDPAGKPITTAAATKPGDTLHTVFPDASVRSVVQPAPNAPPPTPPKPSKRQRPKRTPPSTSPSLFD